MEKKSCGEVSWEALKCKGGGVENDTWEGWRDNVTTTKINCFLRPC